VPVRLRMYIVGTGRWTAWLAGCAVTAVTTALVVLAAGAAIYTVVLNGAQSSRKDQPLAGVQQAQSSQSTSIVRSAIMVPTQDEWADKLRDPAFWNKNKGNSKPSSWTKSAPEPQRQNLGAPIPQPTALSSARRSPQLTKPVVSEDSEDETFRTMCVRTCDGAFFPLSFSTTRENFEADAARCDKQCPGARLFYYANPGAELADMEDLKGQAYKKLPTAFLFRTTYDAQCKCRPHPWEEAARTQHRLYALEAQTAKGSKSAQSELSELKARIKKAELDTLAEKKRAELEKIAAQKKLADDAKAARANARAAAQIGRDPPVKTSAATNTAAATAGITLWGPKPIQVTGAMQSLPARSMAIAGDGAMTRLGGPIQITKPAQQTKVPKTTD
jgi:hypothetical protein